MILAKMLIVTYSLIIFFIKATISVKTSTHLNYSPDVVFIIIDDMRLLPESDIILHNIQNLAGRGIHFQNAFAQQALCAPSRNSFLTGRRPDSLRLYDFYSYWRDEVANFSTIPQIFKQKGYETYSVGKVFHPGRSSNFTDDFPYSWSVTPYHAPSEKYKDASVCKDNITNEFQDNLICPVVVNEQRDKTLPDIEILNHAIDVLKTRNKTKPIFLAVGFHKPHIPLKFPIDYLARVPLEDISPPSFPNIPKNMPEVAWQPWTDVRRRDDIKRLNIQFPYGTMPSNWTMKIKQSYVAASLYVDDLIGKLLHNIDMRKTIVVLTSDHGWSLGENGLWAKYSNFDVALKVPLIFYHPDLNPKTIMSPVELIDIFPTIIHLAGLKSRIKKCKSPSEIECYEGTNLVPLISNPNKFSISQYPRPSVKPQRNSDKPRLKDIKIMGYSLRTKRYRYTEWLSFNTKNETFGNELYDHNSDPYESNNVYMKHKYKHVKYKLSKLLKGAITR
ncbi:iduronate 2-sulfatase isoform X1 [Pieris rapae]|uniref:iduronate 2-sulfatase isoform X1 n=1 Tax=Pieris rapae TaxID=64459 RepID=UPI001E27EAA8|nr:iduronate 2-sulfatase isoform X1 [Pieris rapae]